MIVDTSVWSLALRRRNPVDTPETKALTELIADGRDTHIDETVGDTR